MTVQSLLRRNRNYRLLWLGQVVSQLGDWFNAVAVYALLLELTGSATAVAWMMVVQVLPLAVFGPLAGVLADRVDRVRLMIAAEIARSTQCLALPKAYARPSVLQVQSVRRRSSCTRS